MLQLGGQFKTKIDQTSHTMTFCCDFTQENQHFPTWPFFIFNAFFLFIPLPRWLTVIVGEEFPIDLRMLKSFRCLRPLKMVSKVPSKFSAISAHRDLAPASCRIKSRFLPRFQKKREFRRWVVNSRRKISSDEHTHSSSQPEHRVDSENKSVLDKWMSRSWWIRLSSQTPFHLYVLGSIPLA